MRCHLGMSRVDQSRAEGAGRGLGHIRGQRAHQGPTAAARETGDGEVGPRVGSRSSASGLHVVLAPPPPSEWAAGAQAAAPTWFQRPPPP